MSEIFFRHDPMGIAFEEYQNFDEYDPEVSTILPRLVAVSSEGEVLDIIHEECLRWFQEDAGEKQKYTEIAKEVWMVWELAKK